MANTQPYTIIVGVGQLYVGPANEPKPALTAVPSGNWRLLGETDDGVKITKSRSREKFTTDQRTGAVKAVQTEEGLRIETSLVDNTLENMADASGGTVTVTPPGSGTIGTKKLGMYTGATVGEKAFLYRGTSPYGDYPAQYYLPRGYFDDDVELEYKKDEKTLIPLAVEALEDLNASSVDERFGIWEDQYAAAL